MERCRPTTEGNGTVSEIKVVALVGSLRAASINRKIAELAVEVAPDDVAITVFEGLADLPFYNEEIDDVMNTDAPPLASVDALRAAVGEADAALVVTPEYNGSIPAVVKNAIDWLSRPFGKSVLKGKPLAVVGGSFGHYGGVWGHDETRKSFGIAGARVVETIKLSVPFGTLEGKAPAEHAELVADVRDVVGKLAAEVG
jgi:NAD(P)H-dependent FMN reductase